MLTSSGLGTSVYVSKDNWSLRLLYFISTNSDYKVKWMENHQILSKSKNATNDERVVVLSMGRLATPATCCRTFCTELQLRQWHRVVLMDVMVVDWLWKHSIIIWAYNARGKVPMTQVLQAGHMIRSPRCYSKDMLWGYIVTRDTVNPAQNPGL